MAATQQDLFARLDALAIAHRTVTHPPLFTVEQSQGLRGSIPGGHSKNLFLKDKKDRFWLVTAREDADVDLKSLHRVIGSARLSFGRADKLEELLGVKPGSVTPFGAINDAGNQVTVVLDKGLLAFGDVNFHPLTNEATTTVSADGLIAFLRDTGHEPLLIDLPQAEE
ncbi:MAG: prolyl-tRNA synthetase associated domain-containing protein [Flavobacteriaceae bacterium]